ncbi:ssDNA-specific exonuclease RecJ [Alteromonas macleodii]|jgi:single-stranded-DNA-specific exonuclease|uniref:single-stranded-DNA-specific exonuclease RecJ n=2 Tax=Gammaproteobacteria TaxID=1236 RepID=UPI0009C13945|nr:MULTISPECIES: single-stranded-DNA-specific exonuclease RecJ [Alteromonas]MEC7451327.1 single-stranded-DNA-specific exonuclease RecJ [Pseudomonadota bacterium]MBC6986381.1 single-stranded-DNA-specific exonuclease RecJ [Alteromonas sp. BZK5]MCG7641284.1 single-stranded-DNA-specific exonuclease RecJ [Alteromonas sp. MmMcT2-2]MED5327095.1 single-stranded-DNA-specific exonuclease RecJ [Pseudomonadota bacterium]MEE3129988.1 single-stranded-DNA-specific exonuclease RecJ [Pseudomonadota bacterium]
MILPIVRREVTGASLSSDLHPVIDRIYRGRNIANLDDLENGLKGLTHFNVLKGMPQAAQILADAVVQNKRIIIVGDFDADGATSTSVCILALRAMGYHNVDFLVPNRFDFGYGLSVPIVDEAAKQGAEVIVTVDNGISCIDGVTHAKSLGMQVVVTDHHLPGDVLPPADAIVNPNQPGCEFPSKNLAGVGVAFYIMLALKAELQQQGHFEKAGVAPPNLASLLDIVAVGTVADVVVLDKNNRILVHQGLQRIRAGKCRPGIKALVEVANRDCAHLTSTDLGFVVGPRLNAAGRLDDMSQGIACLLEDETIQARMIAAELDALNKERREIETGMKAQAETVLEQMALNEGDMPSALVVYREDFHQGVIGIVAGRLKEKYLKPVIAFAHQDDEIIKGSARSIPGVHIRDVLDEVNTRYPGVIEKFGGHAMAAGLSLPVAKLQDFERAFVNIARAHMAKLDGNHALFSDGDLSSEELCLPFAHLLRQAGPFGQGFESPLFDGEFALLDQRLVGQKHLKMVLKSDGANEVDAIAFNVDLKSWPNAMVKRVHIAYRLDINVFRGQETVQLIVEQIEAR